MIVLGEWMEKRREKKSKRKNLINTNIKTGRKKKKNKFFISTFYNKKYFNWFLKRIES